MIIFDTREHVHARAHAHTHVRTHARMHPGTHTRTNNTFTCSCNRKDASSHAHQLHTNKQTHTFTLTHAHKHTHAHHHPAHWSHFSACIPITIHYPTTSSAIWSRVQRQKQRDEKRLKLKTARCYCVKSRLSLPSIVTAVTTQETYRIAVLTATYSSATFLACCVTPDRKYPHKPPTSAVNPHVQFSPKFKCLHTHNICRRNDDVYAYICVIVYEIVKAASIVKQRRHDAMSITGAQATCANKAQYNFGQRYLERQLALIISAGRLLRGPGGVPRPARVGSLVERGIVSRSAFVQSTLSTS